ncbi:MAG: class I SAM-dependent methyltransferase [Chitinophagaceae bacterium]|nr:class I SAM-dependent methyltransferase [Chitinophagaceae bacterium]
MILRDIFYSFNPRGRLLLRRIWFFPADLFARIFRKREHLVPPRGLIFTGAGDFKALGNKFAQKFIEECCLSPKSRVLDVGCGIGRLARPLTEFIGNEGSYHGFDIVPGGIKWCRQHYKKYPNFHFDYIPLKNDLYNMEASKPASEFVFPYAAGAFNAACAISVFTHMQEDEVTQYLRQMSRVLAAGGSCLCTFFIITEERLKKNSRNINAFFPYTYGDYYLHDSRVKDANIAYNIEAIKHMCSGAGLEISSFLEGWWADKDRENGFDFQDLLVLRKRV